MVGSEKLDQPIAERVEYTTRGNLDEVKISKGKDYPGFATQQFGIRLSLDVPDFWKRGEVDLRVCNYPIWRCRCRRRVSARGLRGDVDIRGRVE